MRRFETKPRRVQRACDSCGATFESVVFVGRTGGVIGSPTCEDCEADKTAVELRRRAAAQHRDRLLVSGMPEPLREVDFEGFDLGEVITAARRWTGIRDAGGLLLSGPVGVGKTRLAAAACVERMRRWPVLWISVAGLMGQLRSDFRTTARSRAEHITAGRQVLCLDDLDKVNPTEFGREILFGLIDSRVERQIPILVTTNLPPAEIGDRLGEAIMSRLIGFCDCWELEGPDRRIA